MLASTATFLFVSRCRIWLNFKYVNVIHCAKSVQIWSYLWSVFSHIRTEYGEISSDYTECENLNRCELELFWEEFSWFGNYFHWQNFFVQSTILSSVFKIREPLKELMTMETPCSIINWIDLFAISHINISLWTCHWTCFLSRFIEVRKKLK